MGGASSDREPPVKRLKSLVWWILGKDPDAVVVSFASGDSELTRAMVDEVMRLLPERRHYLVTTSAINLPGVRVIVVNRETAYIEARRALRGLRIGMAPVLFDAQPHALRGVALALAPTKILAYNRRLERHHLSWRCPLASFLFWRGVPLDRIWLRPAWLFPWRKDKTVMPAGSRAVEGRPAAPTRGRVAVLTPYLPYPLSHGGAVRLYNLLRQAAIEFDIELFAFCEQPPQDPELAELLSFCHRLVLVDKPRYREPRWASWRPPEVEEYCCDAMRLALANRRSALLQVEYTQLATYLGDILVEHDITQDLYRQIYDRHPTLPAWWNYARWRWFENRVLRQARQVVVMSEKDASLSGRNDAWVIPNGVDIERFQPAPDAREPRLLFIGSFRHFPNMVAFRFFLHEVWPLIRTAVPTVEATVVAGPDAELYWGERRLPEVAGMRILGFVADVRPLYEQSTVVVVPTLESAGTNVKVLEAMAAGRAVVSTTTGCAGLGLRHGEQLWIADGAQAFATGVVRLLQNAPLRERLARAARQTAEERFSWRSIAGLQRQLWRNLAPPPLRLRPAAPTDVAQLQRIDQEAQEGAQWAADEYLRYDVLVAELDHQLIGFVVSRRLAAEEFEILNLVVAPGARRQGVAWRLLEGATQNMRGDIYLEVRQSNLAARRLYEQFGFRNVGERGSYYPASGSATSPETGIVMHYRKC